MRYPLENHYINVGKFDPIHKLLHDSVFHQQNDRTSCVIFQIKYLPRGNWVYNNFAYIYLKFY